MILTFIFGFLAGFTALALLQLRVRRKSKQPMKKEEAEKLIVEELQRGKYGGEYNYNFKPQLLPSPKNSVIIELSDPESENGVFEDEDVIITLDVKKMLLDDTKKKEPSPLTVMSMRNEKFKDTNTPLLLDNFPEGQGILPINAILKDCAGAFAHHLDSGKIKVFSKRENKYVQSITKSRWTITNQGGYGYHLPDKTGFFRLKTMNIDR